MIVLAIDPGSAESAWLRYDPQLQKIHGFSKDSNQRLLEFLSNFGGGFTADHLAIEYMKPRGMPTAKEEMDAQFWSGRFVQAWGGNWSKVYRQDVKMHLCGSMRAKDANIRRALLDRYPATGGGKTPQVGTKKKPGPLFGIAKDVWSALSIAITFSETQLSAEGE